MSARSLNSIGRSSGRLVLDLPPHPCPLFPRGGEGRREFCPLAQRWRASRLLTPKGSENDGLQPRPKRSLQVTATAEKSRAVKPPVVKDQPLFIGGKFVDGSSNKTFAAINPATGEALCQVAEADKADVDAAVKAARKALESGPWKTMDAAERGRLLFKLAELTEQHAEELAALESLNCGKTITDARGDLQGVVNTLRYYAGWADKVEGKTVPVRGNFLSYTLRQPVGVVGQII